VFARQKELGIMPAGAELSRHDPDVPDWDSLSPDARRLAARLREVFAGFLSHTDHQVGRMLDFLRETGEFDNTLIMVVSDNGASPEGGPAGTTNELQFFKIAPEPLEDSIRAIGELGGPAAFNHYPLITTLLFGSTYKRSARTRRGYGHIRHLVDLVCCHLDRNRVLARPCRWPKGPQLHWVLHLQPVLLPGRAHRRLPRPRPHPSPWRGKGSCQLVR
jgi:Sulfatase